MDLAALSDGELADLVSMANAILTLRQKHAAEMAALLDGADEDDGHCWVFESSFIEVGDYDPGLMELKLTFLGGSNTTYLGVPAAMWEDFKAAASPGKFWHAFLKGWPATQ